MNFWNKICGAALILLAFSSPVRAQSHFSINSFSGYSNIKDSALSYHNVSGSIFFHIQSPVLFSKEEVVKQDFTVRHYAFFCRQELHFEKATKIPLRFRLGSVEQCDFYEGEKP